MCCGLLFCTEVHSGGADNHQSSLNRQVPLHAVIRNIQLQNPFVPGTSLGPNAITCVCNKLPTVWHACLCACNTGLRTYASIFIYPPNLDLQSLLASQEYSCIEIRHQKHLQCGLYDVLIQNKLLQALQNIFLAQCITLSLLLFFTSCTNTCIIVWWLCYKNPTIPPWEV